MLKIRRPLGRLIFNMGIAIPGKTVFLIETAPSSFYYFSKIPIILKQHIQSDWITNEPRKPWGDDVRTFSAHGYSKLWMTSFNINKPTTWCKSGWVSLVSSSCLYKTQTERQMDGQTDRKTVWVGWADGRTYWGTEKSTQDWSDERTDDPKS